MSILFVQSSGSLFEIARAAIGGDPCRQSNGVTALVFAALSLEAWVNELLDSVSRAGDTDPVPVRTLRTIAREADLGGQSASLAMKVRLCAVCLTGREFDVGGQPFQDLDLLIACRNAIVHHRPEPIRYKDPGREEHRIVRRLASRGIVRLEDRQIHPLLNTLCRREVGEWACSTVLTMVRHTSLMLPAGKWQDWALMRPPLNEIPSLGDSRSLE
jgi:hypothetical protein